MNDGGACNVDGKIESISFNDDAIADGNCIGALPCADRLIWRIAHGRQAAGSSCISRVTDESRESAAIIIIIRIIIVIITVMIVVIIAVLRVIFIAIHLLR